jgi:hypothetical protein
MLAADKIWKVRPHSHRTCACLLDVSQCPHHQVGGGFSSGEEFEELKQALRPYNSLTQRRIGRSVNGMTAPIACGLGAAIQKQVDRTAVFFGEYEVHTNPVKDVTNGTMPPPESLSPAGLPRKMTRVRAESVRDDRV